MFNIKKGFSLLSILFIFAFSCTKQQNNVTDNGCISRQIAQPSTTSLTNVQMDSIKSLFNQNNLPISGLQFTEFIPDIYTDPSRAPQAQVAANLFLNGLPVFHYTEVFIFVGGIFDTAYLYLGAPLNNDVSEHQSLDSLRKDFFAHVSESEIIGGASNSQPHIPSAKTFLDSCLSATLGYADATEVPGKNLPWGNLIKVWSVTPSHSSYPCVFVEDDNGLAWGVSIIVP
jgi:hypothetical protein